MDAQDLLIIGLNSVVLDIRYRVWLVFWLRILLLFLWHCAILGRLFNLRKHAWFWLTLWVQLMLCCSEKYRIRLIHWLTNVNRCIANYCGMELRLNKCGFHVKWGSRMLNHTALKCVVFVGFAKICFAIRMARECPLHTPEGLS
jgi:hypothetical protein